MSQSITVENTSKPHEYLVHVPGRGSFTASITPGGSVSFPTRTTAGYPNDLTLKLVKAVSERHRERMKDAEHACDFIEYYRRAGVR